MPHHHRSKSSTLHHQLCTCRDCRRKGTGNFQIYEYAPKTIMVPTDPNAASAITGTNAAVATAAGQSSTSSAPFMVAVPDTKRAALQRSDTMRSDYTDATYDEYWSDVESLDHRRYTRPNAPLLNTKRADNLPPRMTNSRTREKKPFFRQKRGCCSWVSCGKLSISLLLLLTLSLLIAVAVLSYCNASGALRHSLRSDWDEVEGNVKGWWAQIFSNMHLDEEAFESGDGLFTTRPRAIRTTEKPRIGQLKIVGSDDNGNTDIDSVDPRLIAGNADGEGIDQVLEKAEKAILEALKTPNADADAPVNTSEDDGSDDGKALPSSANSEAEKRPETAIVPEKSLQELEQDAETGIEQAEIAFDARDETASQPPVPTTTEEAAATSAAVTESSQTARSAITTEAPAASITTTETVSRTTTRAVTVTGTPSNDAQAKEVVEEGEEAEPGSNIEPELTTTSLDDPNSNERLVDESFGMPLVIPTKEKAV